MALHAYEIPLSPHPQRFSIKLGGVSYQLRFYWNPPSRCWMLDIAADDGTPLVNALPVVTGGDLLAQYEYLGIVGALIAQTDYLPDAVPTFDNLGEGGRVYFITE